MVQPHVVEKKELVVETPVQMEAVPKHIEIPIKTGRKPRGPNKPKEPVIEESVFSSNPVEVETVAPSIQPVVAPAVQKPVEEKKVIAPAVTTPPVISTAPVSAPTTPVRVSELAKLVKMWVKASGLKINDVDIVLLKTQAFDIVENDSDDTIIAGIKEAARLMQG
jgi:septal ring-binding cell division protein DamX